MKRVITYLSAGLLLVLMLSACRRETASDGRAYGFLTVALEEDTSSSDIVVKAPGDEEDPVFSLLITPKDGGEAITVADHRALAAEPLKIAAGNYTIVAKSGTLQNAAWDAPYYEGQTDILIKPEQENVANITATQANTAVTVQFPPETDTFFTEYRVIVDNGRGDALVFGKSAGSLEKTAYFAVTGQLNWEVYMVNTDGTVYRTNPATYEGVKAKQHYHLTFTLADATITAGAGVFSISVDGTMQTKTYPLVMDFSASAGPAITAGFEITNEITVPAGSTEPMQVNVAAAAGIKSLTLSHSSADLAALGIPAGVDLVDASADVISALGAAGITASSVAFGSQSASFDIGGLIDHLPLCAFTLSLTVIDAKNNYRELPLNIEVISPVDAEVTGATPWARFAIISAKYFVNPRPEGLNFQYRKASDSEWTDFGGDISFNETAKTFKAELYGLEPQTEYVLRAVSNKDKETKEISFTTDKAEFLHNMNFDSWWQDGSCWYPNESSSYSVWDSANPGTSGLGVVPTTPETSDVAVSGSGKKAARLESSKAMGQFAAGNIYVGQFNGISGLGAKLKWGVPFTSRPLALTGYYKYSPKTIDNAKSPYTDKKGQTDCCSIKIYLTDWSGQFDINTSTKQFLQDDDASIIALGELYSSNTDSEYVRFTIPLRYRDNRTPKYIVISGAASRYGDYFTGGLGSVLLLDEFSFVYDAGELTETERELVGYRN